MAEAHSGFCDVAGRLEPGHWAVGRTRHWPHWPQSQPLFTRSSNFEHSRLFITVRKRPPLPLKFDRSKAAVPDATPDATPCFFDFGPFAPAPSLLQHQTLVSQPPALIHFNRAVLSPGLHTSHTKDFTSPSPASRLRLAYYGAQQSLLRRYRSPGFRCQRPCSALRDSISVRRQLFDTRSASGPATVVWRRQQQ